MTFTGTCQGKGYYLAVAGYKIAVATILPEVTNLTSTCWDLVCRTTIYMAVITAEISMMCILLRSACARNAAIVIAASLNKHYAESMPLIEVSSATGSTRLLPTTAISKHTIAMQTIWLPLQPAFARLYLPTATSLQKNVI